MRMYYVIGVLITLFLASCGEPPMPPSDEEMIRHFATHEAAFRKVYEIMSESSEGSFHYPPLSPDGIIILDSIEQSDASYESNDEQDRECSGDFFSFGRSRGTVGLYVSSPRLKAVGFTLQSLTHG